ncbi:MAG: NACHT domain-containing protein [Candidatus Helarchaeota archaeon]|nr:NACHT domain-containing protein [Candidatus Helarchaeota archaeon]
MTSLGSFSLKNLIQSQFNKIFSILSPSAIKKFCTEQEIKKFEINTEMISNYLSNYKQKQIKILNKIDFLKIKELNLTDIYIFLRFKEYKSKLSEDFDIIEERSKKHPTQFEKFDNIVLLKDIITTNRHILIIGHPGSGKTTELKKFCLDECKKEKLHLPVFIPIRTMIAEEMNIFEYIENELKLIQDSSKIDLIIDYCLNYGKLILCIDGLDELDTIEPENARKLLRKINADIQKIIQTNNRNIIITSIRKESFLRVRSEINPFFKLIEILPLLNLNIKDFIKNWFRSEISIGNKLIQKLIELNWPELTKNPLLLTLICVHFDETLNIPSRISSLYRQSVELLLEKWDATRRISRYPRIDLNSDIVNDLLMEIALYFHLMGQACFNKDEIIKILNSKIEIVGIPPGKGMLVFEEISLQYGLLCSWSIEKLYAFPHLSFQEYFVALALRDKDDGYKIILKNVDNPFWKNVILFYIELGDATKILSNIMERQENVIYSYLFLAAECLSRDPKISDYKIRNKIIDSLGSLANGKILYLQEKAIDFLAKIPSPRAVNILRKLLKYENSDISSNRYAFKYSSSIIGIKKILKIIETDFINSKYFNEKCLENLYLMSQEDAITYLTNLINKGLLNLQKPDFYHRITDVARYLVEIGQEKSIPIIIPILKAHTLTYYSGFISQYCFNKLQIPDKNKIFEKFLDDAEFSLKTRISFAQLCNPSNLKAKKFLLSIISNKEIIDYDRRDAAKVLCYFNLDENDLLPLKKLLFNLDPNIFWGASAVAAKAILKVQSKKSVEILKEALNEWKMREKNKIWKEDSVFMQIEIKYFLLFLDTTKSNFDFYQYVLKDVLPSRLLIWYEFDNFLKNHKFVPFSISEINYIINTINLEIIHKLPFGFIELISRVIHDKSYNVKLRIKLFDKFINIFKKIQIKSSLPWVVLEQIWEQLEVNDKLRKKFFKIKSKFHKFKLNLC